MRIVVVNGNISLAITELVVAEARLHVPEGTVVDGMTAAFGVGVVSTEATNAIAGHAVLDALARAAAGGPVDAAVLAISFDTALAAAQELMPFPVVGMTEAALHTACLVGRRFGMVTFGQGSRAMYLDLVARSGLAGRMAGCVTVDLASAAAYRDVGALDAAVAAAITQLAEEGAGSVVLSAAAVAGMARRLQPDVPVALLDGVACAVRQAVLLAGLRVRGRSPRGLAQSVAPHGLSDALTRLL